MPLAPGQAISGNRIFFAAGGSGSSGPGQIPPLALGPLPTIGAEGTGFAYQVNAIGTLPLMFTLIDGAVPTGMTLDGTTGLITGTCAAPDGGLYNFTIQLENDYGTTTQAYAILIDGTAPTISYPTIYPYSGALTGAVLNTRACTSTGSTGGSPAQPIVFSFISTPDPLLNTTLNTSTGEVTMTPDASLVGNYVPDMRVRATNYFGQTADGTPPDIAVVANIYYGEWHGALPGTFTSDNITIDVFDDLTPGPRIKSGGQVGYWIAGDWAEYPATVSSYYRILAIPHGMLIGNIALQQFPVGTIRITDSANLPLPCPDFTPAWPTPYQSGLVIDGVEYDVYVVNSRTTTIELFPWAA